MQQPDAETLIKHIEEGLKEIRKFTKKGDWSTVRLKVKWLHTYVERHTPQ